MSTEHTAENQLQFPVLEKIGDETIEFRRLDLDDLLPWANEMRVARKTEAEQRYKADPELTPYDRHRLMQEVIDRGIDLGTLMNRSFEPAGIRKVLVLGLKKAGKSDADALAILKRIHYGRQARLAQDVLSPPAPPAPPKADDKKGDEPPLSDSTGE